MRIDDSRRARVPPTHPAAIFTLGIFTRTDGPYGDGVVDLAGRRVGILDAVASRVDAPSARPACLPPAGGGSSACASCHPAKRSGRDAVRCWSGMGPRGSTGAAGSAPGMKNGPVERSAGPSVRLVLMRGVEPPTY